MAFTPTALNVVIASPADTGPSRDAIEAALHSWNSDRAESAKVVLVPRRWETDAVPSFGGIDAQDVINSQLIDSADIVFGVFYSRLGMATARGVSGTAEEIERAADAGKPVHVYFSSAPLPSDVDTEQLEALRAFQRVLRKRSLLGDFASDEDLRAKVRTAIERDVATIEGGEVAAGGPVIDINVRVVGSVRAYTCDPSILADFLRQEEARLLGSLPQAETVSGPTSVHRLAAEMSKATAFNLAGTHVPERRSEEDFRAEVAEYAASCNAAFSGLIDGVLAHFGSVSKVVVENGPSAFLRNVEIELHLSGPIDALEVEDGENFSIQGYLPEPPQEFGDKCVPYDILGGRNFIMPSMPNLSIGGTGPTANWSNSGSVTVDLASFDIRPEARLEFDEHAMLVVRDPATKTIECAWKATADGFHEVFRGTFALDVEEPLDITEYVRTLLEESDETD